MTCKTVQPPSARCTNPSVSFETLGRAAKFISLLPQCDAVLGRYYCSVCKFFDSDPRKQIFHCEHCGICRVRLSDFA
jgi:hypothetical protein